MLLRRATGVPTVNLWGFLRRFPTVYLAAGDAHSGVPIAVDELSEIIGAGGVNVCEPLSQTSGQ